MSSPSPITKEHVAAVFSRFNALIFEGRLVLPPIRLTHARSFLAKVESRRERTPGGAWRHFDFHLVVAHEAAALPTEADFEDVMIHEMIHLLILSTGRQDTSPHGKLFRLCMDRINADFDRHVSISYRRRPTSATTDGAAKTAPGGGETLMPRRRSTTWRIVGVVRLVDGRVGVVNLAKRHIFAFWHRLGTLQGVAAHQWFGSDNAFFAAYPRVSSLKVFAADETALREALAESRELVLSDGMVRACGQKGLRI